MNNNSVAVIMRIVLTVLVVMILMVFRLCPLRCGAGIPHSHAATLPPSQTMIIVLPFTAPLRAMPHFTRTLPSACLD